MPTFAVRHRAVPMSVDADPRAAFTRLESVRQELNETAVAAATRWSQIRPWWERWQVARKKLDALLRSRDPDQRDAARRMLEKLDASDLTVIEWCADPRPYPGRDLGWGEFKPDQCAEVAARIAAGEVKRTVCRDIVRQLGVAPDDEIDKARNLEDATERWERRHKGAF